MPGDNNSGGIRRETSRGILVETFREITRETLASLEKPQKKKPGKTPGQ